MLCSSCGRDARMTALPRFTRIGIFTWTCDSTYYLTYDMA